MAMEMISPDNLGLLSCTILFEADAYPASCSINTGGLPRVTRYCPPVLNLTVVTSIDKPRGQAGPSIPEHDNTLPPNQICDG